MKRSTNDETKYLTVVYKYGCPAPPTRRQKLRKGASVKPGITSAPRMDFTEAAMTQLRRGNDLWNALVGDWQDYQEVKLDIWRSIPDVADAMGIEKKLLTRVGELQDTCKQERLTLKRQKTPSQVKLKEAKKELTEARAERRAIQKPHQKDSRFEDAYGAFLKTCTATRKAHVEMGLFWANGNAIIDNFHTAHRRLAQARAQGKPSDLRKREFDGTGTITANLQAVEGDPLRSPELVASDSSKWRNQARIWPWKDPALGEPVGRERYATLRIRVDRQTAEHPVEFMEVPVICHRMLPADAQILRVQVTRRLVANRPRLTVAVTARYPAPTPPKEAGPSVTVRLRWKSEGGGWLIAGQADVEGVRLPPLPLELEDAILVSEDGCHATVRLDPEIRGRRYQRDRDADRARTDYIRMVRDNSRNDIQHLLADALRDDPALATQLGYEPAEVRSWRRPARMLELARKWPKDHALWPAIKRWRIQEIHLWAFEANERDQLIARRKDFYRKVAHWLLSSGDISTVYIYECPIGEIKRTPALENEDPFEKRQGRKQIHDVAPGEFGACVKNAARTLGIPCKTKKVKEEAADET